MPLSVLCQPKLTLAKSRLANMSNSEVSIAQWNPIGQSSRRGIDPASISTTIHLRPFGIAVNGVSSVTRMRMKNKPAYREKTMIRTRLTDEYPGLINFAWHAVALSLWNRFQFLLLLGDTGCGKTEWAIEQSRIANAKKGYPPLILSLSPESERSDIWGRPALSDGKRGTVSSFNDGLYPLAQKNGLTIVLDEYGTASMDVRGTLLSSRGQKYVTNPLNSESIQVHDDFRLIATSNVESVRCNRSTTQMIAKALFDAFVVLEVPRIEIDTIRKLLNHQFPNAKQENVDRTLELWDSYRTIRDSSTEDSKTGESFLSYRAASQLLQCLEDGIHEDQAVLSCICSKFLTDDDLFKVAKLRASIS